jgi:hypothetical protein
MLAFDYWHQPGHDRPAHRLDLFGLHALWYIRISPPTRSRCGLNFFSRPIHLAKNWHYERKLNPNCYIRVSRKKVSKLSCVFYFNHLRLATASATGRDGVYSMRCHLASRRGIRLTACRLNVLTQVSDLMHQGVPVAAVGARDRVARGRDAEHSQSDVGSRGRADRRPCAAEDRNLHR